MTPNTNYNRLLLGICIVYLVITVLPFIVLSFYCSPLVDDFVYASSHRDLGFLQSQIMWYTVWTGRYMATLLICINPVFWDWSAGYIILPIILIVGFCMALYYFITSFSILQYVNRVILFLLVLALYFSTLLTVGQTFYWMAGAFTYTVATTLMLVIWGYIFRIYREDNKIQLGSYVLLGILLFIMLGLNELIVFYNCYIALLFVVHSYFKNRSKLTFFLIILGLSVFFGLLNTAAPGNMARQGGRPLEPFSAIYTALSASTKMWMVRFITKVPFIITFALIVIIALRDNLKRLTFLKLDIHPFLLFCALYGGYVFTFLPGTLANAGNEARTLNFSYFTFLLAIFVSTIYAVNYYQLSNRIGKAVRNNTLFLLLLLLVPLIIIGYPENRIALAYDDIFSGKAKSYKEEITARHAYLETVRGSQKIYLKPLVHQPHSYFKADVRVKDDWRNAGYQDYFKIDTVRAEY